jgi:hypothetical protein
MRHIYGLLGVLLVVLLTAAIAQPPAYALFAPIPAPQATEEPPPDSGGNEGGSSSSSGVNCKEDGRIDIGCAAPIAVYSMRATLEIHAIDPATGQGELVIQFDLSDLGFPPVAINRTLVESANPFTGQTIILSYLTTGELQINTAYADGKSFVIVWRPNLPGTSIKRLEG